MRFLLLRRLCNDLLTSLDCCMPHARHLVPTSPMNVSPSPSPPNAFSGLAGIRRRCIEGRGKLNYVFNRMTGCEDGLIRTYGLENVAGAGKTAITHSLSRRCYDEGILSSPSSFDREIHNAVDWYSSRSPKVWPQEIPLAGYVPTAATLSRANETLLRLSSLDSLQFSF